MRETCPYRVLGVAEDCSTEVLVAVYRHLAKVHHPDKGGSAERFQEIQAAYDLLRDDEARARYDQHRHQERGRAGSGAERDQAEAWMRWMGEQMARDEAPQKHYMWHANQGHRIWNKYPNSIPKTRRGAKDAVKTMRAGEVLMRVAAGVAAGGVAMAMRWNQLNQSRGAYKQALEKFGITVDQLGTRDELLHWGLAGFLAAMAVMTLLGAVMRRQDKVARTVQIVGAAVAGMVVGQSATRGDSVMFITAAAAVAYLWARTRGLRAERMDLGA